MKGTESQTLSPREVRAGIALLQGDPRSIAERNTALVRQFARMTDRKLIDYATDLHRQFFVNRSAAIPHDTQSRLRFAQSELESRGYKKVETIAFIYDERADRRA